MVWAAGPRKMDEVKGHLVLNPETEPAGRRVDARLVLRNRRL